MSWSVTPPSSAVFLNASSAAVISCFIVLGSCYHLCCQAVSLSLCDVFKHQTHSYIHIHTHTLHTHTHGNVWASGVDTCISAPPGATTLTVLITGTLWWMDGLHFSWLIWAAAAALTVSQPALESRQKGSDVNGGRGRIAEGGEEGEKRREDVA